jgi:hypothetical protein
VSPSRFTGRQTKSWYVQIGKKQVELGKDKNEAFQKYHGLMAGRQPVTEDTTVYAVLFNFWAGTSCIARVPQAAHPILCRVCLDGAAPDVQVVQLVNSARVPDGLWSSTP